MLLTCRHCDWQQMTTEPKTTATEFRAMIAHAQRHGYLFRGWNIAELESIIALPEDVMDAEAEPSGSRGSRSSS
jgi:hypothetical protein